MSKLREITDKIYDGTNRDKKMEANEIYYKAAEWIEKSWPDRYNELVSMAEDIMYEIDYDWAYDKVKHMRPYGECWTFGTIKEYVSEKPIECDPIEYYLCMNMAYNDYKEIADRNGLDITEFCYTIAKRFIEDEDAPSHKVAKYFCMK